MFLSAKVVSCPYMAESACSNRIHVRGGLSTGVFNHLTCHGRLFSLRCIFFLCRLFSKVLVTLITGMSLIVSSSRPFLYTGDLCCDFYSDFLERCQSVNDL